jgi:carbamoyl-phosphate synthase small subunit
LSDAPTNSAAQSASHSAYLVLADGTTFVGRAFGAQTVSEGEVVFNTSMTGYPELLTDPSYRRQILTLTYPEIGNYGVTHRDGESDRIQAAALVVRALSPVVSSWRSEVDLSSWLRAEGIPGISGIDTRALVRRLRDGGTSMGLVSTEPNADVAALRARARALPGMAGCELISQVTCAAPYAFTTGLADDAGVQLAPLAAPTRHVVAYDFGVKRNMLRMLVHHGCRVTVVPAATTAEQVRALAPDGVLLSNGPGDPSTVPHVVAAVRALLGTVPIFGICMGHQVLGQALGASTYKTAFGHRGGNQPVILDSAAPGVADKGRVLITSQNHGFAVKPSELVHANASEHNLSDDTNEAIDSPEQLCFSVQYHPEAAPGPHDASIHFVRFIAMMDAHAAKKGRSAA